MNLAYKKILGKFTKVLGFGKTPPHVGKISQIISFFLFESVPYFFQTQCICIHVYVYMCVCMCISVCMRIHMHVESALCLCQPLADPLYLSCLLCANYCLLCALSTFSFALFFSIFYMFFYIPFFFISLASFVPIIG